MRIDYPTPLQQLATEARLNGLLGATAYDSAFPGFTLGAVIDHVAFVWAADETSAVKIEARYQHMVIAVLREMLDVPVEGLNVLPARFPFYA